MGPGPQLLLACVFTLGAAIGASAQTPVDASGRLTLDGLPGQRVEPGREAVSELFQATFELTNGVCSSGGSFGATVTGQLQDEQGQRVNGSLGSSFEENASFDPAVLTFTVPPGQYLTAPVPVERDVHFVWKPDPDAIVAGNFTVVIQVAMPSTSGGCESGAVMALAAGSIALSFGEDALPAPVAEPTPAMPGFGVGLLWLGAAVAVAGTRRRRGAGP